MKDIRKGQREREKEREREKTESAARDVRAITPRRTKKDESRQQEGATRRGDGETNLAPRRGKERITSEMPQAAELP